MRKRGIKDSNTLNLSYWKEETASYRNGGDAGNNCLEEDSEFSFDHIKVEMPLKYPSGVFKQELVQEKSRT